MRHLPFILFLWASPFLLEAQVTTALTVNPTGTVINANTYPINFQTQTVQVGGANVLTHNNVVNGSNITLVWNGTTLTIAAAGIGTGTVTSFTSGNLSPLFTTAVTTGTSTPSLTYTLTAAAQNAFFAGPSTGGAGTPSFRAIVPTDIPTLNQNTTGSAGSLGTGTYLPFFSSGVPSPATSSQVQAVIGAGVYEVPLTFSTGLTQSGANVITVNTSQNISTLSNLTTSGFVTTSGTTGALSVTIPGVGVLAAISGTPTGTGSFVLANGAALTGSVTLNGSQVLTSSIAGTQTLTGSITGAGSPTGTIVTTLAPSPNLTGTPTIGGTLSYSDTGELLTLSGSTNSYAQLVIQNLSSGSTASSDLVVNNNSSTATTFYGDFGMNSSTFTGTGSLNAANYVYVTSTSSDLAIGTTTANGIHFVVNSGATDAMAISSAGVISMTGTATLNGSNILTLASSGTLTLTGSVTGLGSPTGTIALALSTAAPNFGTTSTGTVTVGGSSDAAGVAVYGVANGSTAAAGYVGQVVSALVVKASAVSLTTNTPANITSISLTAGDWDVQGAINFSCTTASTNQFNGTIGTTSATLATDGSEVDSVCPLTTATMVPGLTIPRKVINVSTTTTVYLVGQVTIVGGTVAGYGQITARRIR